MRVLKPISINPTKEKALFNFLEAHGTKKAVTILFDFYQNNNDLVQNIVDRLQGINFKPQTTIKPKKLLNEFIIDDDSSNMLSGFIK